MLSAHDTEQLSWQQFVLANGYRARAYELAHVVGQPVAAIDRLRLTGACRRLAKPKRFAELFQLWHGRLPKDEEWPVPRKNGGRGTYEWQAPEDALLATLIGQVGTREAAQVLTQRLRDRTKDPSAERSVVSVWIRLQRIGLQANDVVGGITVREAGRELGATAPIYAAIRQGAIQPFRVGRFLVIRRDDWERWKARRSFPPKGYVQLSGLRRPLGLRSDAKLPEYAANGYIPTAVRCNPFGLGIHQGRHGTWFIDARVARKLIADRRAGRPMPWYGKPQRDNLKVTWRKLQARRHPPSCRTCAHIWGRQGPPRDFDDYLRRYPPLERGAKRHLTRPWSPGMTVAEVARHCRRSEAHVRRAIANGTLTAARQGRCLYISRSEATHWRARKCPAGAGGWSWVSLTKAATDYDFSPRELKRFIASGRLRARTVRRHGAATLTQVSRHQCGGLRRELGFTEAEAARRVGVSRARLRQLLKGARWRVKGQRIPLDTVNAIRKRVDSRYGFTLAEAAKELGMSVGWIEARARDGTVRISRGRWGGRRRVYLTGYMLKLLQRAKRSRGADVRLNADWLLLSRAAFEAGVSPLTLERWAEDGGVRRRRSSLGWRYHRKSVRARARRYWQSVRFHRAIPPAWLQAERRRAVDVRTPGAGGAVPEAKAA